MAIVQLVIYDQLVLRLPFTCDLNMIHKHLHYSESALILSKDQLSLATNLNGNKGRPYVTSLTAYPLCDIFLHYNYFHMRYPTVVERVIYNTPHCEVFLKGRCSYVTGPIPFD